MSKSLFLFTISGQDHPGITAELMQAIAREKIEIIDIGQSITHGLLSLSFILNIPSNKDEFITTLSKIAQTNNVELGHKKIDDMKTAIHEGEKYILSCVSMHGISANFICDISSALAKNNINIQRIDSLGDNQFNSLDISTMSHGSTLNWDQIKSELIEISNRHNTDLALLKDNVWRRNKRLIVFDMDSTLIQSEVIDEMARHHGVYDDVHKITEQAMNGKFDFDESLKKRVKLLAGLEQKELHSILSEIKLTEGVEDFIRVVKTLGYKVAIISGGFTFFAEHFKNKLNIDYAFANELEISQGKLTGNVKGPIVNAEKKAMLVELISQQEGFNLEQVVAIGDGANDLPMLAKAGLGIAFHAKEIVKQNAQQHMSHGPMTSILYFLGIPGKMDF